MVEIVEMPMRLDKKTASLTASSEISDQEGFEGFKSDNSDNEGWEVVGMEEASDEQSRVTSNPTLKFTWRSEFSVQSGRKCYVCREGSSKLESYGSKMSTVQDNYAISAHEHDQGVLFSLPIELRLRIYEEVLFIESSEVRLKWYPANYRKKLRPSVLSILETCRRIHGEAESIFYSINQFQCPIETSSLAPGFFQSIGPIRRDAIRSLTVSVSSGSKALALIQDVTLLSKLQKLRIERQLCIRYIDIGTWVVLAKQLKTELKKLGELRELEIVTPETVTPTPEEEQRMQRLVQIDCFLQEVTTERNLVST